MLEWSAIGVLLTLGPLVMFCWVLKRLLEDLAPGSRLWNTHRALPHSLTLALGLLTVWSFSWVSPPLGMLVVLTAALSSPAVLGRALHCARESAAADPAGVDSQPRRVDNSDLSCGLTPQECKGPLRGLDDQQLCRLWRESFWVLSNPAPPGTALYLVALREACLDEMERRDAGALHAWLASGARASSGPERYLIRSRRRGAATATEPTRGDPR
jgi:hypothetical protein